MISLVLSLNILGTATGIFQGNAAVTTGTSNLPEAKESYVGLLFKYSTYVLQSFRLAQD